MVKKQVRNICGVCGRPLEQYVCLSCLGTGKIKIIKRICDVCGGTGRVLQCPNQAAHLPSGVSKAGHGQLVPGSSRFAIPTRRPCPTCKGTKGIRMPFTGQAGPCPTCKGKGWV